MMTVERKRDIPGEFLLEPFFFNDAAIVVHVCFRLPFRLPLGDPLVDEMVIFGRQVLA